ncbi:hypothetical protein C2G38_672517 [Gigaspora rosea]|uniref:XLF-like N-terminal domain-containing protein n=1 Tax=Gigaspora rosea TaxID=44941 RepID=A0A397U726_9GLOM|nr:hypothetical protein C2G38_672517 [Gigaspora rosea]
MAFSTSQNETLRSALWIPLQVNSVPSNERAETYLAKAVFTDQSYLVLVTNLRYVWFEELLADEITKRFQESQSFFSPILVYWLVKSLMINNFCSLTIFRILFVNAGNESHFRPRSFTGIHTIFIRIFITSTS